MKCRVCNKTSNTRIYDIGYYCEHCLSISSFSHVTPEAYSTGNYASYRISRFESFYIRINAFIRTHGFTHENHKSWLDIGCGKGTLLSFLKKRFSVSGIEPESSRAAIARSLIGKQNIYSSFEDITSEHDVISAYHVLEHFDVPNDLFVFIAANLNLNGVAIIEVPNMQSIQAKLSRRKWPHWDKGIHRTHFSRKGISSLADNNGLIIQKVRTFSLTEGVLGMLSTILCLEGLQVYSLLKKSVLMKLLIIPMLSLALVLEIIASLLKRGGVLRLQLIRCE